MHTNNLLVAEQFGFKQGMSTENAAFKVTESVSKYINYAIDAEGILSD
jgi:hypothetical protein